MFSWTQSASARGSLMDRRTLLLASLSTLAVAATHTDVAARQSRRNGEKKNAVAPPPAPEAVAAAVQTFADLGVGDGAGAACLIEANLAGDGALLWRAGRREDDAFFVGGAVNTFILAAFLRQQEAGKLNQRDLCVIDDSIRSLSSPVFLNLTGRTPYTSVLEAMIAHGDDTAADATLAAVGVKQVRDLTTRAGLKKTRAPDSTRRMTAWLAGGRKDTDPGWQGLQAIARMKEFPDDRSPLNDVQTMQSSAADLVAWYRAALAGKYFSGPQALVEFKRIHAMADVLTPVAPQGALIWGKGGQFAWRDFRCHALAGQMLVNGASVTFAFVGNWARSPAELAAGRPEAFQEAVGAVLARAAEAGPTTALAR